MFDKILKHLRLLPLLIFVAMVAFAVRLGDVIVSVNHSMGGAIAQDAELPPDPSLLNAITTNNPSDDAPLVQVEETTTTTTTTEVIETGDEAQADNTPPMSPPPAVTGGRPWVDAIDADMEYSEVRAELFEALAERRRSLDAREAEITKREALLAAAESEINQKYDEMESLREEIQGLLQQQSEEEEERIVSLVKVYEGMKAKDAANIFNTLDMDILISVMGRMSERKLAPILAEMNPDRARSVTIFLAEQKSLPTLPNQLQGP